MQMKAVVGSNRLTKINVDKLTYTSSAEDRILLPYCGELTCEMHERAYIISMCSSPIEESMSVDFVPYERVVKSVRVNLCFNVGLRVCGTIAHLVVESFTGKTAEDKFVVRLHDDTLEQILDRYFNGDTGLTREHEDLYHSRFLKWKSRRE